MSTTARMYWRPCALFLISGFAGCGVAAQQRVTGHVVDEATGEALAYVTIGIPPSGPFTYSRTDGTFALPIADGTRPDTIQFSCVGYHTIRLPGVAWSAGREVRMRAAIQQLPMVDVTTSRVEERLLGVRSHHAFFSFLLEAERDDEDVEMAQVVDLGPSALSIKAVNFFLDGTDMDSATIRVGFRGFDGERPTGPLVQRSMVRRVALSKGWVRIDLASEQLALAGKVVVDVEVLPEPRGGRRSMSVGIRLGGGPPGFKRRSTFATWDQMPHRWSINVSALVPVHRPEEAPEDPDPFLRAVDARLWSPAVNDTFSIAFGLPDRFDPARPGGYPTVYLLDANLFFPDVVQALHTMTRKGELPPVIVVGVGYRDIAAMDSLRQRDYLTPASDSVPGSGGGDRFLRFLAEQLVPYVNERFPTDSGRCAIAGHSFGGYFTLHALLSTVVHGDTPFTSFVAAGPAADHDGGALARAWEGAASEPAASPLQVFIGHEDEEMHLLRCIRSVQRCLGAQAIVRSYPGADHMAVALPAFTAGLRALWGTAIDR